MELCLGMGNDPAGTLWVSISVQSNVGSTVVGVCYRPPSQEEVKHEVFFRKKPHIGRLESSWKTSTILVTAQRATQHKQSRRSLEHPDNSFPTSVIQEPMGEDVLLDFKLTKK